VKASSEVKKIGSGSPLGNVAIVYGSSKGSRFFLTYLRMLFVENVGSRHEEHMRGPMSRDKVRNTERLMELLNRGSIGFLMSRFLFTF
jgi:hypothetical protein